MDIVPLADVGRIMDYAKRNRQTESFKCSLRKGLARGFQYHIHLSRKSFFYPTARSVYPRRILIYTSFPPATPNLFIQSFPILDLAEIHNLL